MRLEIENCLVIVCTILWHGQLVLDLFGLVVDGAKQLDIFEILELWAAEKGWLNVQFRYLL